MYMQHIFVCWWCQYQCIEYQFCSFQFRTTMKYTQNNFACWRCQCQYTGCQFGNCHCYRCTMNHQYKHCIFECWRSQCHCMRCHFCNFQCRTNMECTQCNMNNFACSRCLCHCMRCHFCNFQRHTNTKHPCCKLNSFVNQKFCHHCKNYPFCNFHFHMCTMHLERHNFYTTIEQFDLNIFQKGKHGKNLMLFANIGLDRNHLDTYDKNFAWFGVGNDQVRNFGNTSCCVGSYIDTYLHRNLYIHN